MYIRPKGSPSSPVWVLLDRPMLGDLDKGYLYSSPTGFVFDKMMQEAGIKDYYVTAYRPDTEHPEAYTNIVGKIEQYKPPIIIPLGAIGSKLLPQMIPSRRKKDYNADKDSEISKYCGSLLVSSELSYPHYIIPTLDTVDVIKQWKQRDIIVSCDLAKAAAEVDYYNTHNRTLQLLPSRELKIDFESFDELLFILNSFHSYPILSNDIETIYPKAPTKTQPSKFYKILPGYPLIIGLAPTIDYGISFDLFRDSTVETRELWKVLAKLLWEVPSLGQNFYNFDANFYEMLGFRIDLTRCRDTLIQHHILWAELKHTLQFQTRQYTREPYYKDEGHGWSNKDKRQWKRYNVKDCCVTLEIDQFQQEELKERNLL